MFHFYFLSHSHKFIHSLLWFLPHFFFFHWLIVYLSFSFGKLHFLSLFLYLTSLVFRTFCVILPPLPLFHFLPHILPISSHFPSPPPFPPPHFFIPSIPILFFSSNVFNWERKILLLTSNFFSKNVIFFSSGLSWWTRDFWSNGIGP